MGVNPSKMSAGTYTGAIHFSPTGGTTVSVPVTLIITSVTCVTGCGGGTSTGAVFAHPFVFDPNSTGTLAAAWVDYLGEPTTNHATTRDPGLVLSRNAGAPSGSYAGAMIRNFTGSLSELGFDVRSGSQCAATSPRFVVVTTDNITHVSGGCSKGTSTPAPVLGWTRVRFTLSDTTQMSPAITPGEQVSSIVLLMDLGPEAGAPAAGGVAIIDNIDINGTFAVGLAWTSVFD